MIRRATGKIGAHIKPFIYTTIYNRALINRDKGIINQEQGSTTLIANQTTEKLEIDNSSAKKLHFFSEIKELVSETPVSTPSPTK